MLFVASFLEKTVLVPFTEFGAMQKALEDKKIQFSFKDGQRITSKEVLCEAIDVCMGIVNLCYRPICHYQSWDDSLSKIDGLS
mgnify:CR=1 FL=1